MPATPQAAFERTHYEELGIARNASVDEVRKAYRHLALQLHPDKCPDPDAAARFIRVNEAWETLSKPSSRHAYDIHCRQAELQRRFAKPSFTVHSAYTPIAKLLDMIKDSSVGAVKIGDVRLECERCGVKFPIGCLERAELLRQLSRAAQGELDHRVRSQDWNRLAREDLVAWLETRGCSLQFALACDTVDKERLILLVRGHLSQKGNIASQPRQESPAPRATSSRSNDRHYKNVAAGVATPARSPSKPSSTPKSKAKPGRRVQMKASKPKAQRAKAKANPLFVSATPRKWGNLRREPSRSLSEPWGTPKAKAKAKAKATTDVESEKEKACSGQEDTPRPPTKAEQEQRRKRPAFVAGAETAKKGPRRHAKAAAKCKPASISSDLSSTSQSPSSSSSSTSSSPSVKQPKRRRQQVAQKPEGQLNQRIEELCADLQAVRSSARADHPKALPTLVELVKLENEQRIDASRQRRLLGELNKAWWRREVHGRVAWHASSLVLKWTARRQEAAKSKASN